MKKVFYLKNCGTCTKILSKFNLTEWELREIKTKPLTEEELDEIYKRANSYEALFSKRSTQIKARNIDIQSLTENDFKKLILLHYSFLKRPIFLSESEIFIGNDKKNIENLERFFDSVL